MKWKAKEWVQPNLGDIVTQNIFALVPHKCTDGYWHWLETIVKVFVYVDEDISTDMAYGPDYVKCWKVREYRTITAQLTSGVEIYARGCNSGNEG